MKHVSIRPAAKIISTIPNIPVIICVKYRTAIIAAIINLITLSAEPMFFFIIFLGLEC